ncbi:YraN family protein [Synechococcus sp. MIT S9503]|uniref:YraN family protein n=1 Tax=Synechococcus sp. MIT S9503 TaxID=3082547 RepID=UPI0039A6CB84
MRAVDAKSDPGLWAEQRALALLNSRGWHCLDARWTCRYGEIDLMMIKPDRPAPRLLMVEVKARAHCGFDGWGVRAFDAVKRRRLARALACWHTSAQRLAANPLQALTSCSWGDFSATSGSLPPARPMTAKG